jgi:hypothetical protein
MSEENRGNLTLALWFFSAVALAALTTGHIALAFTILALAGVSSPLLLRWKDTETQQEKTKQHRIDNMLHNLSDEELVELKRRLSDSDFNDEKSVHSLGDDGELIRRR